MKYSANVVSDAWKLLFLRIFTATINGITNYCMETTIANIQTNISTRAIINILENEVIGKHDLEKGRAQYFISQGSSSLSKLIRLVFLDFMDKFCFTVIDLYRIYDLFGLKYLVLSFILMIFSVYIHLLLTNRLLIKKRAINLAKGRIDKNIYEIVSNMDVIKTYKSEKSRIDVFKERIKPWGSDSAIVRGITAILELGHALLFRFGSFLMVLILIKKDGQDGYSARNMYSILGDYDGAVEYISYLYRKIRESALNARMVLHYLKENIESNTPMCTKLQFNSEIRLENVSYAYRDVQIFNNLTLVLKKGEKVVLSGRNGTGKSTLFKLILRLLKPQSGSITIDNLPLDVIEHTDYRELITYAPQDTALLDDTVFNNIVFGNNKALQDVFEICRLMKIHEDILKLSNGYNTEIGDGGSLINGGLRQKIFYARALLRDSDIYLFDEPTNNLDSKASELLLEIILSDRFRSKTFLVISHDSLFTDRFPKVLKFSNGALNEIDTNK